VAIENPDALRGLHREFLAAGAQILQALTFFATREKLARGFRSAHRGDQYCHPDDLETIQVSRQEFPDFGRHARREGISYVGGCCGCNAVYIRTLAREVDE
jgi:methionine synthase I (cobalamin-dependent)